MTERYQKLKHLLEELFQLNRPELDFGIYRVLRARSAEISTFLDDELLPQVRSAFEVYRSADRASLEQELDEMRRAVQKADMDPAESPKVRELEARIASTAVDLDALEAEVYEHLYRFFRRYYSDGDFLSKRVYKEGVYAIPYEGEEVKLHWANADQYYTKTSEYLRDYAFQLRPGEADPMRVHFRLVDAAEGEHDNVKESENRVFVLATGREAPFMAEVEGEAGPELEIRFEYRPATMGDWPPEKREEERERLQNPKPPKQKDLDALAMEAILEIGEPDLARWIVELGRPHVLSSGEEADYTRLEANLRRYNERNTSDYFIHQDLGGFLRRELDFYIKNEVMHLDDIENESVPRVEQYLSKIKVVRRIAGKIIDFLAQLEDFQKKLWLKKKFVVETSWCVALGSIPDKFHPEIAANDAQREEWIKLHAIDEVQGDQGDLTRPRYSAPLTAEFLAANPTLMVDTRHFDEDFTARLLEALDDLDELTDGVLFHGENFQALSLMQARYRETVKCVYIDPPYNTGNDGFAYKDSYRHSSWMTMMADRVASGMALLGDGGLFFCSIDRDENRNLLPLLFDLLGEQRFVEEIVWQKAYGGGAKTKWINNLHEYVLCFTIDPSTLGVLQLPADEEMQKYYRLTDEKVEVRGRYRLQPLYSNSNDYRENLTYPLPCPTDDPGSPEWDRQWAEIREHLREGRLTLEREASGWQLYLESGGDRVRWSGGLVEPPKQWQWSWERTKDAMIADEVVLDPSDSEDRWSVSYKQYQRNEDGSERGKKPSSLLRGPYTQSGTKEVTNLFAESVTKFPKPIGLIRQLVGIDSTPEAVILDYFAGSGTTGHAVINLNRDDGGRRKFILVEMGPYFDTVLLPRLKKVTFTPEWKDGKPQRPATPDEAAASPRVMKVLRLESYEDTLNNLETRRTKAQQDLLDDPATRGPDGFREDYLLRYMLDVETRESLLDLEAFSDPGAYRLKVKRPGSVETREVAVDLVETFNWLVGLTVERLEAPRVVRASTERDDEGRLRLVGDLASDPDGEHRFRAVTGTLRDGRRALVIWRRLTGNPEVDNLVLDEWFTARGFADADPPFDLIYVNGGNNLEGLRRPEATWRVKLIEDDFHRLMFAESPS